MENLFAWLFVLYIVSTVISALIKRWRGQGPSSSSDNPMGRAAPMPPAEHLETTEEEASGVPQVVELEAQTFEVQPGDVGGRDEASPGGLDRVAADDFGRREGPWAALGSAGRPMDPADLGADPQRPPGRSHGGSTQCRGGHISLNPAKVKETWLFMEIVGAPRALRPYRPHGIRRPE